MQHLQRAEWTLMMLQVEDTVIPSTTPVRSMCLEWEIYLMSGRSLWRSGATSLWEHLCNPHGNKTKKHGAAHSLAWPNAADNQRSGWNKTLISEKLTRCRGFEFQSKDAKKCIKKGTDIPGLVHGFRKAVFVKWRKITSNHSCASHYDARQPTMEKATGPHVSKLFWAPLQYAAGIHTEVIHRGLVRAVMVNSKRVSRCPWESRWTVTEGLSRISVTLPPWEHPLRTTQKCIEH